MMKKLFYVLIGLCAFCSCESTGYRISGYIPGAPDGAKVYLAPYDAFQDPNWDSTVIKNERFVLKNTIPMVSPRVVAITIDLNSGEKDYSKIKSSRALFLKEGDRISMECHVDSLPSSRWEARDKSLNVVWQGSADQDLYVNYLKDRKDVVIERNKLGDQYFMDYYKKSDVPSDTAVPSRNFFKDAFVPVNSIFALAKPCPIIIIGFSLFESTNLKVTPSETVGTGFPFVSESAQPSTAPKLAFRSVKLLNVQPSNIKLPLRICPRLIAPIS